uniref:Uncharacterized protein n=1 Tax=Ditylenchus dipsaci TaxID=166011 RepID=A0A915EC90_9BILA
MLEAIAHWITACHKNGFELQLAVGKSTLMKPSEVIYMKKWLDTKTPSPLPLPAFTTIGLGAVVMNDEDEYLVLAENPENDSARTRKLKAQRTSRKTHVIKKR